MTNFKWNKRKSKIAVLLADGFTIKDASEKTGVSTRTIDYWKSNNEFQTEVDRLSHMVGIASKAERMRIVKRIIRQKLESPRATARDLLDWLKFARDETDGIKLDLSPLWDLQQLTNDELLDLEKIVNKATNDDSKQNKNE
jgi:DNA-binding transcriptional MerR regulator